jgi:hypothetical protein
MLMRRALDALAELPYSVIGDADIAVTRLAPK